VTVAATVTDAAGAPLAILGPHDLTTAVTEPRPGFRFSFLLDLGALPPTGSLLVDAATTQLEAAFEPLDVQPASAALRNGDGIVIVELDAPREVRSVQLKEVGFKQGGFKEGGRNGKHAPPPAPKVVRLFRLDGEKPADKPTISATTGSRATAVFAGPEPFVDARFAIGLEDGMLASSGLARVTLRSYPTDPRLALADAATGAAEPFFFHAAGLLQAGDTAATVHGGAAFADALQAFVDARGAPPPQRIRVDVESDAECRFRVSAFAVGAKLVSQTFAYGTILDADLIDADALAATIRAAGDPLSAHLRGTLQDGALTEALTALAHAGPLFEPARFAGVVLSDETKRRLAAAPTGPALAAVNRLLLCDAYPELLAAPDEKRVLRFASDAIGEQAIAVELPAGAHPTTAQVSAAESLRGDRPAGADGVPTSDGSAGRRGVHVGADAWTAVPIEQAAPLAASGLALRLLPLVSATAVRVELQSDRGGRPGGSAIAGGTLELGPAGEDGWASLFLPEPTALGAAAYWLLVRAASGSAVWLGEDAEAALRLLTVNDDGDPERESTLAGLRPSFRLFSRDRSVAEKQALALRVGGAAVPRGANGGYDAAAALEAAVGAGSGSPVTIALVFAAAGGGTVSVPPPRIEYTLS
jgi:hypothetical protein